MSVIEAFEQIAAGAGNSAARYTLAELLEAYEAGLNEGRARARMPPLSESAPKIKEIQTAAAAAFGCELHDMVSACRSRHVARPRQVAMYLCQQLTMHSLPVIGRHFGGRDHTTVMHAIARVKELATADPDFGARVVELRQRLSGD